MCTVDSAYSPPKSTGVGIADEEYKQQQRALSPYLPATLENILTTIKQNLVNKGLDAFWNLRDYLKDLGKIRVIFTE